MVEGWRTGGMRVMWSQAWAREGQQEEGGRAGLYMTGVHCVPPSPMAALGTWGGQAPEVVGAVACWASSSSSGRGSSPRRPGTEGLWAPC